MIQDLAMYIVPVHNVSARSAIHNKCIPMQLDSIDASSFEVQAVHILSHNVAVSRFGGENNLERSKRCVSYVGQRTMKLLKSNESSDPISFLLQCVGHELVVGYWAVVGFAHISAVATPAAL